MPSRTYGNIHLVNRTFNFIFGDWVDTHSESHDGLIFNIDVVHNYLVTAPTFGANGDSTVDVTAEFPYDTLIPIIPSNALITQLRFVLSNFSAICNGTSVVEDNGDARYFMDVSFGNQTVHYEDQDQGPFATVSRSGPVEIEVNFSGGGRLTRAQLITVYSTVALHIFGLARAYAINAPASGDSHLDCNVGATILTVTYDEGPYSWYVKPTKVIIGGLPVDVIANAETDIIQVPTGEEGEGEESIPEGYVLYGTDIEFPDGIIYYWWETVDVFLYYVFSPIAPGPRWTSVGVDPPSCVGCRSMMLGELEILVADASGVYTLVLNKESDTLYDRASESTIDVKIPNPSAKTGFLP